MAALGRVPDTSFPGRIGAARVASSKDADRVHGYAPTGALYLGPARASQVSPRMAVRMAPSRHALMRVVPSDCPCKPAVFKREPPPPANLHCYFIPTPGVSAVEVSALMKDMIQFK